MRRGLLLSVAALPILLAGCSSSSSSAPAQIPAQNLQPALTNLYQQYAGVAMPKGTCDGTVVAQEGSAVKCTITDGAGTAWPATVTVAKVHDGNADLNAAFVDPMISVADANANVATLYKMFTDADATKVACVGLQKAAPASVRPCVVTDSTGKTVKVSLSVSSVSGDKPAFQLSIPNS
ncbi:DUF4333 domain-containing protein [Nocardia stercoris]|nr:DUF4333 domain-containing protein [Nocardia stercoris]